MSFLNIKESNQCDLAPSLICISMPLAFLFFMIFSYTTCETTPDLIFYIISITFEQSEVLASVYQPYLYLPRPVSRRHPMDIGRRAKQFAPFAALRGLDETVRQQEILYEPRKILSEEKQNELDNLWPEDTSNIFRKVTEESINRSIPYDNGNCKILWFIVIFTDWWYHSLTSSR